MKIKNRLYLQQDLDLELFINFSPKHSHYLAKVLRSRKSDYISVFNDTSEYLLELIEINAKSSKGKITEKILFHENKDFINLYFSPIKRIALEVMIQKCTEIGVTAFHPIIMEHTQSKTFNIERLKLIAIEAIEQSDQNQIPIISEPINFTEFFLNLNEKENIIACSLEDNLNPINQVLEKNNKKNFGILIGPEGDFSKKEVSMIKSKPQIIEASLGSNILKSETAAIVSACLLKELSRNA